MMRNIYTDITVLGVKRIMATSSAALGYPLRLEFRNGDGTSQGVATIFLDDESYARRLADAINAAAVETQLDSPAIEAS
jgi:hypothetical protein